MIKQQFDVALTNTQIESARAIVEQAADDDVRTIINIGTSVIESTNACALARAYDAVLSVVGIHPNDCTSEWKKDFLAIKQMVKNKELNKIVGVGECGLDMHYPGYDLVRQQDAFKAHIELALESKVALVVHTRDAAQETLRVLEEFKNDLRGSTVIHCFSEDLSFAQEVIQWGMYIGIGGAVTYPKNQRLRDVVCQVPLETMVLETDAPFLPVQSMRGKQNHPRHIKDIAQFVAHLRNESFEAIAHQTTANSRSLFKLAGNESFGQI